MKLFRRILIVGFIACGIMLRAASLAEIQAELKNIQTLDRAVQADGVAGLLAAVQRENRSAPAIHSKYYADKLAARVPEVRELEQAKRDLGLHVALALDAIAKAQLQNGNDSAARAARAEELLSLADWLKATKSYGNYLLVSRCESLAAVPLAHLTADLGYPIQNVSALRKRLMSLDEERAFRIAVLHEEAERTFIGAVSGDQAQRDLQVESAWNRQWRAMADWFKSNGIAREQWRNDRLPDELAIILDDDQLPEPWTTSNTWNSKWHRRIVNSARDIQIRNVDQFILFREKVNGFPTQPPGWWKPGDLYTRTAAAFENAWRPFEKQYGPLFQGAAQVYDAVKTGRFVDRESDYLQDFEAKRGRLAKP